LAEEYGATVWDRGIREQTQVGQAADRSMGCEPELVRGRPCDLHGCAAQPRQGTSDSPATREDTANKAVRILTMHTRPGYNTLRYPVSLHNREVSRAAEGGVMGW
jgi:hypothetical protein